MKIWVKLYRDERLVGTAAVPMTAPLTRVNYEKTVKSICEDMDLSTPVGLSSHFKSFADFNSVKYLPRDFIETVDFDYMTLEAFEP